MGKLRAIFYSAKKKRLQSKFYMRVKPFLIEISQSWIGFLITAEVEKMNPKRVLKVLRA